MHFAAHVFSVSVHILWFTHFKGSVNYNDSLYASSNLSAGSVVLEFNSPRGMQFPFFSTVYCLPAYIILIYSTHIFPIQTLLALSLPMEVENIILNYLISLLLIHYYN